MTLTPFMQQHHESIDNGTVAIASVAAGRRHSLIDHVAPLKMQDQLADYQLIGA